MLQLSLFGPFSLRSEGHEIRIKSLKLRAILGYVALNESLLETRERLVGLLWSESGEAQARAVLRQVVRELREIFAAAGSEGLTITSHEIGFERQAVDVDVWTVVRAAEAGEVHPLLLEKPRLTDDLLAGLDDLDPSFRVWVLAKRQTLRDRLMRALEGALAKERRDPHKESLLAEAIINLDPTHEEACRRMMRACASTGRTAHALRAYKALWELLDDDYGMEPATATQELVAQIKLGAYDQPKTATDASAPASLPILPSASVVPEQPEPRLLLSLQQVDTKQVDPAKAHLVIGFRQLLIASLVKFRDWHVTDMPLQPEQNQSQKSTQCYEIQMFASQKRQVLQLTLMLKALDTGYYIWSDGFELKLSNWFDSQRRVIRRVAMALNVHLSAERLRLLSEKPHISVGVHDKWLRCQTLVRTFDPQHWANLTKEFDGIIEAAPQFVPAYCGLADLHTIEHIAHPGIFRSSVREQKALELARKAVELDAADIHAHRCLAWAYAMIRQYGQAEVHMQVATELNPNDSWTAISGALLFAFCGQYQRAAELSQLVLDMTLSPSLTHWAYQADIQFLSGNYQAAIEAADRARDVIWGVPAWRTAALAHLGRVDEASVEANRFLTRIRTHWFGAEPATDAAIVRWLLHLYPIRQGTDWERLRDGLKVAGLPTDGSAHDAQYPSAPMVSNIH